MKIPKSFKLFGTTVNIVWDNKHCNDIKAYGEYDYSLSRISLSTVDGTNELSKDRIMDTYYHEKVHALLEMMKERDLSDNEKFVDVFAKLLRQSDETSEY
jgi:hypothetical protein